MFDIAFVLGGLLILLIFIAMYRVIKIMKVARGVKKDQEIPSNNAFQGTLLLILGLAGLVWFAYYSYEEFDNYNLPVTSLHGADIDYLFWITTGVTVLVFVVTQIFLFGFSWRYKYKKNKTAYFYPHNNTLEIIWTTIPAIVLAVLVVSGLKKWHDITGPAPDDAQIVEVMGYQYAWAFRYPGKDGILGKSDFREIDAINTVGLDLTDQPSFDDFLPTQLVIPKGKAVLLKIRSRDVIHSVFNPHFRVQMNAVPGMPTQFWFVPTVSTAEMREKTQNEEFNYELICNKICGKNHYGMRGIIVVLEENEYASWYKEQQEKSWLKLNPDYLSKVPKTLREAASIASGIEEL